MCGQGTDTGMQFRQTSILKRCDEVRQWHVITWLLEAVTGRTLDSSSDPIPCSVTLGKLLQPPRPQSPSAQNKSPMKWVLLLFPS